MANYIDKEIFGKLILKYIETNSDDVFNELMPLLKTLYEMVLYKYNGRKNWDMRDTRMDYDSIEQGWYIHCLYTMGKLDKTRQPFAYFYKSCKNYISQNIKKNNELKKTELTFTEIEGDNEELNLEEIIHEEDETAMSDETFNNEKKELLEFCQKEMGNAHTSKKEFYKFIILILTEKIKCTHKSNTLSPSKHLYESIIQRKITNSGYRTMIEAFTMQYNRYKEFKKLGNNKLFSVDDIDTKSMAQSVRKHVSRYYPHLGKAIEDGKTLPEALKEIGVTLTTLERTYVVNHLRYKFKNRLKDKIPLIYAR